MINISVHSGGKKIVVWFSEIFYEEEGNLTSYFVNRYIFPSRSSREFNDAIAAGHEFSFKNNFDMYEEAVLQHRSRSWLLHCVELTQAIVAPGPAQLLTKGQR